MKKKTCNYILLNLFFVQVLIFSTGAVFCQTKKIDSLKNLLITAKEDTNKVNTLNELCFQTNDLPQALKYGEECLQLANKLKYEKGIAGALDNIGIIYSMRGDFDEALKKHMAALQIRQQINDKEGIAKSYMSIGHTYAKKDNLSEALKNFYAALKGFEAIGDKKMIARAYQLIGGVFMYQGNRKDAKENIEASLRIRKEIGDLPELAQSYNSVGIPLIRKNSTEALQYFSSALEVYKQPGTPNFGLPWTHTLIALTYQAQGDSAHSAGNKKISEKKYAEALENLLLALKEYQSINDAQGEAEGFEHLGKYYLKRDNFQMARQYFSKALLLSHTIGSKKGLYLTYKSLSMIDSIQGDYKQALAHYKMYILYRDSIFNEESTKKSEQSKMQYRFDKKEDSLKQKQFLTQTRLDSQKKQKNYYLGGAVLLALLSVFVFLNFRNQKKINRLMDDAHAKEKAELELQSLRAQLNPHFMFNSLNAIQELILLEENEKSQSYLARFAKLLRLLLENADKSFIPLQREIDFLQLYLSLENLRIPDLQFSITVDPNINTEETQIPNMILQPYIENAIWHGLSHKESDKRLAIRINNVNGSTKYEIEDNGVGRKRSAELKSLYRKEHKSKGMELLAKRFKLLSKEYGSDIETGIIDIKNGEEIKGTLITIKVQSQLP